MAWDKGFRILPGKGARRTEDTRSKQAAVWQAYAHLRCAQGHELDVED